MKYKFIAGLLALTAGFITALPLQAQKAEDDVLKKKLASIGLPVVEISDSPLPNIKQVISTRGVFYISEDGKHVIAGRIFDVDNNMENLTESVMNQVRLKGVEQFKDSMIVYPAKNEQHVITVFTDTTCGFCKKLHGEIPDYNKLGITIQYLAFPRGGLYSKSFAKLENVWCADDKNKAMDLAKSDKTVASTSCSTPIAEHYDLGKTAGVTGTPAMILNDGSLITGYQSPEKLARFLSN